jgi:NAD(P)-dependent dehydrogenase (short-subunit alcohol dehydrogenase family)
MYNDAMFKQNFLDGRKALITGAGVRLGRAFAIGLAAAGCDVVIHYNSSAGPAEETAAMASEVGAKALTLQANLTDLEETKNLMGQAIDSLGRLDILINNASIFDPQGAKETTASIWQRNIDVNLRAAVLLTQSLGNHLGDGEGDVINLLDWRAFRPGDDHFAYTIAKAGLAAATRSLARAYAPNLRVNGLALGAILPPPEADGERDDTIIKNVPAGRWGTVDETVNALLFLVGGPRYITGEIIHLDGGRHLI